MNPFERLTQTLQKIGGGKQRGDTTRFTEIQGQSTAQPLVVKTREEIERDAMRFWRSQEHQVDENPIDTSAMAQGIRDIDSLHASETRRSIVDHEVQERLTLQSQRIRRDTLSIFPQEIQEVERILHTLDLLPEGFTVCEVSVRGSLYDDMQMKQIAMEINFKILPTPEAYPFLATRGKELIPSSSIGRNFALSLELVKTNDSEPQIQVELSDPDISSFIFRPNRFTPEELHQLADEKQAMEKVIARANASFKTNMTCDRLIPLLEQMTTISERISNRIRE